MVVKKSERKILLAVTGASGSIYAQRMLEFLLATEVGRIYIVCSEAGKQVADFELKHTDEVGSLRRILAGDLLAVEKERIRIFRENI